MHQSHRRMTGEETFGAQLYDEVTALAEEIDGTILDAAFIKLDSQVYQIHWFGEFVRQQALEVSFVPRGDVTLNVARQEADNVNAAASRFQLTPETREQWRESTASFIQALEWNM